MTFKVKSGIQVGSITVVDQNSHYQQTEALSATSPSLVLDFTARTLDGRITFARSSSATVTGQNKLIQSVTSNTPRFDHDPDTGVCKGLLVESASVNYCDNTSRGGAYSTSNLIEMFGYPSPSGEYNASRMKGVGGTAVKFFYKQVGFAANGNFTFSIYAKFVNEPIVLLRINDQTGGNGVVQRFNIQTGVLVGAPSFSGTAPGATNGQSAIFPAGNGWYRLVTSCTMNSSPTVMQGSFFMTEFGNTTAATSVDVWGAQLEGALSATSYIPSTDTFTSRASTATFFDSTDGLLKTAAINTPRPFFNPTTRTNSGILLEPAITNYFINTETLSGNNTACTITSDATAAPDGTLTADKMVEIAGGGGISKQVFRSANTTAFATPGTYCTFSIFAKAAERHRFQLDVSDAVFTSSDNATFNLLDGTVTYNGSGLYGANIIPYPNGWYRCSLTAQVVTNTGGGMFINMLDASGGGTYIGDGTSGLFLWGYQLELGTQATSYIPAAGTLASRLADIFTSTASSRALELITIVGDRFRTGWHNPTEGTLVADWIEGTSTTSGTYGVVSLNAGGGTDRTDIRRQTNTSLWSITSIGGLNTAVTQRSVNYQYGQRLKAGMTYRSGDYSFATSATAGVDANTSLRTPSVNQIQIGGIDGSFQMNSWLRSIVYYPEKLANTTLLAIVSQEN